MVTKKVDAFFLRDLALARVLTPLRVIFRFKILYEAHIISYLVSKEQHTLLPELKPVTPRKTETLKRRESFVFRNCDAIFVLTSILKHKIIKIFSVPATRIAVIPDGVNLSAYNTDNKDRDGLVYIGQLYPWKGVDTLIEAMCHIDSTLTVLGGLPFENDLERIKEKTKKLGLEGKITFVGFVPPHETAKYLNSAKISVIPLSDNIIARDYTSPLKLFETMAAKTAVVASDLPSIREIIAHGKNGMLCKPGDSKSLADAVNKLLNDDSLFNKIVEQAYSDVKQYSWQMRTQHILRVMEKL